MFKRISSLVLAVVLLLSVSGAAGAAAKAAPASGAIPGQYIVVFKDTVSNPGDAASDMARKHGLGLLYNYSYALKGFAATIPSPRLSAVQADPRVLFVSDDHPVSAFDATGELPFGVDRIEGEKSSPFSASNTSPAIAVIDTGSGPHSDLNIAGGKNCSTGKSFNDGHGHGTHVAGTIAAIKNDTGVVGVLPGAPIYSVRVLNNTGSGTWSSVICGVDWVTANANVIKVANMSLGGPGSDDGKPCADTKDALKKAICGSVKAGVTYVVAAGNSAADLKYFVPAAYDVVLSVTAMADFNGQPGGGAAATCLADVDDTAADFSNFATLDPDKAHTIAAPGVCIKSTWKGGGYKTISGTSMASPHAAGTAALCIASRECAGLTPEEIIQKLRSDAAEKLRAYPNYGFTGIADRYYGDLTFAGGY